MGLQEVSMPFNPTRGPHLASCDPGQKDFNLNSIYSSNGKGDRLEHVGANLTPRAVYSTSWCIVVRDILNMHPLYLSCLQDLQDSFYEIGPNYSNVFGRK